MHSPENRTKTSCLMVATVLLTARLASSAEFVPLGFGTYINFGTSHLNVSEDGLVIAGATPEHNLVRWTPSGGATLIHHSVAGPAELSGDGSVIIYGPDGGGIGKSTPEGVELLEGFTPWVLSQDGSTIIGWRIDPDGNGNHVRLREDSVTDLPILYREDAEHFPSSVSAEGDVVVGFRPAYRWSVDEGLHHLSGFDGNVATAAWAVSSDGRWVVGDEYYGVAVPTQHRALRWDGLSGPEPLLALNETWGTAAKDVSVDGRTVVGRIYVSDDRQERDRDLMAGVWLEQLGYWVPLQDLLSDRYGIDPSLDGYHLTGVYDVTDDGRFMVGHANNPNGIGEAFLVDLGLPGDFNSDNQLDMIDLNELTQSIQSGQNNLRFDLDYSNIVDLADRLYWVKDLKKTFLGDANLDGEFNSSDFTSVFLAGEYEDAIDNNSGWAEGDWDGDGDFTSGDFVVAYLDGGYEKGPRMVAGAVPEPTSIAIVITGLIGIAMCRRMLPVPRSVG